MAISFFLSQGTNSGRSVFLLFLAIVKDWLFLAVVACIAGPAGSSVRANFFTNES